MFKPIYDPQALRVISDETLRRRVNGHSLPNPPAVRPKPAARVAAFDRWPGTVRAIDLLQLLGEAMTPTLPAGEFDLSSRWAFYRYFWAFAPAIPGRPLRLSDEASRLVDHHRTLASEQLGIGASLLLGQWLIQELNPDAEVSWSDADLVVDRGSVDIEGSLVVGKVPENRRMRPDYFFTAEDSGMGIVNVYAIEAKGTHTAGHYVTQMKKGASQVASITINGSAPEAYIFSTELNRSEIIVRVLDPAGDASEWSGRLAEIGMGDPGEPAVTITVESGIREIVDADRFRRAVVDVGRASLLAFAGQYEGAAERLPPHARSVYDIPPLPNEQTAAVETELGRFEVIEAQIPLGQSSIRIRAGLDADVLVALRQYDDEQYSERRQQLRQRCASLRHRAVEGGEAGISAVQLDENARGIRAMRPSGSYLEVLAVP